MIVRRVYNTLSKFVKRVIQFMRAKRDGLLIVGALMATGMVTTLGVQISIRNTNPWLSFLVGTMCLLILVDLFLYIMKRVDDLDKLILKEEKARREVEFKAELKAYTEAVNIAFGNTTEKLLSAQGKNNKEKPNELKKE